MQKYFKYAVTWTATHKQLLQPGPKQKQHWDIVHGATSGQDVCMVVTCVFSGGVGQVESMSSVMGPTHELDSDPVAGGIDEIFDFQTQTAVFHC